MYALILPTPLLKNEVLDLVAEYEAAGESRIAEKSEMIHADFDGYIEELRQIELGLGLQPGHVPSTTYWLVDDERRILGVLRLRHWLTPRLERVYGHIGYDVRPSERRKGNGTIMLGLGLERARELGLKRVLVTCDVDNIASARIIEHNGGILENQVQPPGYDKPVRRYWIEL